MVKLEKNVIDQIEPLYLKLGSAEKVGKTLNICPTTVVRYLKRLDYSFESKTVKITISYQEALKKFQIWNGSLSKFCKQWHICLSHFTKYLRKHGIQVKNYQNSVKFDETVFDTIDTEEKAYWLGFIFADGYISSKSNKKSDYNFEISLKGSDTSHLEKFNIFMKHIHNNIRIGSVRCGKKQCSRCRWSIRNKHLWETLNSHGCTPRKSLTLQFPDEHIFQSKDLIRHFIRGYFDGDGCITYCDKSHLHPHISFLGTFDFLAQVAKYTTVKNKVLKENNRKVYIYGASGKTAMEILHYMYKNSTIFLQRKFDRYIDFCRLEEKSSKLLQDNIGEG